MNSRRSTNFSFLALLGIFLFLGLVILGFNRNPFQILAMSFFCVTFELSLNYFFNKQFKFPMTALITSFSLSILIDYPHGLKWIIFPAFFAISSKYFFTYNKRHFFNPALVGIVFSLLFLGDKLSTAPAYQWNSLPDLPLYMAIAATFFILIKVDRIVLSLSFIAGFIILGILRNVFVQVNIPSEALVWGSIKSPAFILFSFYMITDPVTSPSKRVDQFLLGLALAFFDFLFHLDMSFFTFFYAGFSVALIRWTYLHIKQALKSEYSFACYFTNAFKVNLFRKMILILIALTYYKTLGQDNLALLANDKKLFSLKSISLEQAGFSFKFGNSYFKASDEVKHVIKWLESSVGGVGVGDINQDGLIDIFLTNSLQDTKNINSLYLNLGNFTFKQINIKELESYNNPKVFGLPSSAYLVDYDQDSDLDILVNFPMGHPVLIKNLLAETKQLSFRDVTHEVGLDTIRGDFVSTMLDVDRDGELDLIVLSNIDPFIHSNNKKIPYTFYNMPHLPKEDLNIMPENWSNALNGGEKFFFLQKNGKFILQNNRQWHLDSTPYSLAINSGDFNNDGYTDFYIANDFGPDELYLNDKGTRFQKIRGSFFGDIGRDTYKGMNVSIGDLNNDQLSEIYVSNVHYPIIREGSILWSIRPKDQNNIARVTDMAESAGVLNEDGHGWGAVFSDLNLDGFSEIIQTNGMFDRKYDIESEVNADDKNCYNYWYANEKISRSSNAIQKNAYNWTSVINTCIMPNQELKLYLNLGTTDLKFFDIAPQVGLRQIKNSRAISAVDFDNNGTQDLFIVDLYGEHNLYRNMLNADNLNHWIGFNFESHIKDCPIIGTTISLIQKGPSSFKGKQQREIQLLSGFSAQSDPRVHFGIGPNTQGLSLQVKWCGRKIVNYTNLKVDQYQKIIFN